jgi:murein DD-endopeptidase MepM/ murein hydrolase activator NlpD
MHTIDPIFRKRRQAAVDRRRRARRERIFGLLAGCLLIAIAGGGYLAFERWRGSDIDENLNPVDTGGDLPADASVYVPTIVDLPGDPIWITLARGSSEKSRKVTVPKPAGLTDPAISPKIEVLSDTMLSSSEQFMATIPSTQEDFAFFQAQRNAPPAPAGKSMEQPPAQSPAGPKAAKGQSDVLSDKSAPVADLTGGWGQTIDSGQQALPAFKKTSVENNTTVATMTPEADRFEPTEDFFVKVLADRTLASVVSDNHFSDADAKQAQDSMAALFKRDGLIQGDVVALRGFRSSRSGPLSLRQVSIYSGNKFVGSLAREDTGPFLSGVDPWVRNDLFHYSGPEEADGHQRQYRLLDAICSTAVRNDVPSGVIGEAIMYLSRGHDLNAFANQRQRLDLIYSDTARGTDGSAGRVLYAAVRGTDTDLECFVYQDRKDDFACVSQDSRIQVMTTANGMVTPVNGVLTSTFGPSKHPILDTVRVNKGVDWVAPLGTPVVAAFDGQISFQAEDGGYGNTIRISHSGGRQTLYAHLQRFAMADGIGKSVKAGDVIGYVGTTGVTTGPSLHFELYQNGVAIDPLGNAAAQDDSSDDAAVATLTDRIIRVESGGSAQARNPLSSATGLGQFIDSTWLRMMRTYRPELARTLSASDLLALRYDPTISKEMVRNLAREGEAYLRARGDAISAGRLYLCHFLGMEGAHQILSAPADSSLVSILGPGVIRANPFLAGKDASYVIAWAEKKMGSRGAQTVSAGASVVTTIQEPPPGFEDYRNAIVALVASLDQPAAPTTPGAEQSSVQ